MDIFHMLPGFQFNIAFHMTNQITDIAFQTAQKHSRPDSNPMMQNAPPKPKPYRMSLDSLGQGRLL
ncbi:hypothetical protein [Pseudomonas sp. Xaverov 259]|uniref:hypothetical protein n=1 Tax=Pseudomonas sp. Xaverov 259 TaxID=2666086 RepID=UPI001C5B7AFC|nr:hypothetical protein [Pseudomonas sp. Xaverov 259]